METDNPRPGSNRLTDMILGGPGSTPWVKPMHKTCLWCGKELIGPSYKKYCNAKHHNAYNNKKKAEKRAEWKKIIGPMEQNDKFLEPMYKKFPDKEWPSIILQNPSFDGDAPCHRLKDDRSEFEGQLYTRYSIHENPSAKTFKILYHG